MATVYGELPFGIRDCKVTPWVGGALDTAVDVPRIRSVEVNVTSDSTDLDGDDVRVATHTFGKAIEGSIEAGGVNLAAIEAMAGGTLTNTPGPPKYNTYIVQGTDVEGYFKLEGQMISDDAGDMHIIIWRAKISSGPNYAFTNGEFALTNADIVGNFDASVSPSRLYSIVQNDVVTAIT